MSRCWVRVQISSASEPHVVVIAQGISSHLPEQPVASIVAVQVLEGKPLMS